MKRGDWVSNGEEHSPIFGRVRAVYNEPDGEFIDLVVFSWSGTQLGRVSPALGGPTGYEPFCRADHYTVIERPSFPLPRDNFTKAYGYLLKPAPQPSPNGGEK